jgi:hypothetical protein
MHGVLEQISEAVAKLGQELKQECQLWHFPGVIMYKATEVHRNCLSGGGRAYVFTCGKGYHMYLYDRTGKVICQGVATARLLYETVHGLIDEQVRKHPDLGERTVWEQVDAYDYHRWRTQLCITVMLQTEVPLAAEFEFKTAMDMLEFKLWMQLNG